MLLLLLLLFNYFIIFSPPPGGIYISYYLLFYRSPIPPCTARTQHCTIITASTQHCTIYYISISYNSIHTAGTQHCTIYYISISYIPPYPAGTQHCTIYYISISYNSRHTALYYSNIASHSGIKLKLVEMVCTWIGIQISNILYEAAGEAWRWSRWCQVHMVLALLMKTPLGLLALLQQQQRLYLHNTFYFLFS